MRRSGSAGWPLVGAEAVLKLRVYEASRDFDAYWDFHDAGVPAELLRKRGKPNEYRGSSDTVSGPLPVWLPETAVNGSERQRTTTDGRPLADEGQRSPAAVSRRTICTAAPG